MKKLIIVFTVIAISGLTYGAQLEIKGGFEPWREGNNPYSSFDMGGSLGAELLFNAEERPFDYGIGIEWKSKFSGGNGENVLAETKPNAFPIYLTGKYAMKDDLFYLVGRTGWTIYDESDAKDGFYGAIGVGKELGHFTLEALYESMDLSGSSHMYSGDRANVASIKLGYKFGENKRDIISREKETIAKAEYEKMKKEEKERNRMMILDKYKSLIVVENYKTNELYSDTENESFFKDVNSDLARESGILKVISYTDNRGSKKYNKKLSQQRADEVANKIKSNLTNENIDIISEGLGETNFLNDNSSFEKRKINRRTEVNFIVE